MNKNKERIIIKNGKLEKSTEIHPDEGHRDKRWIAELFTKIIPNAEIVKNIKNNFFIISIDGNEFNFVFDTTDSGGKYNSRKVSVPFARKTFKDAIQKFIPVYVVNIYRDMNINNSKIAWSIISPQSVYESDAAKQLIHPNITITKNRNITDSSRWVQTTVFQKILNNKSEEEWNKNRNVLTLSSEKLFSIFLDSELIKEYKSILNFFAEKIVSEPSDNITFEKDIKNSRTIFRKVLLKEGVHFRDSKIFSEELLIASHIRPVYDILSDNKISNEDKIDQIVDVNNGLLLPTEVDKLFDKYHISFNNSWDVLRPKMGHVSVDEIKYILRDKLTSVIVNKTEKSFGYLNRHNKITESKYGKLENIS